MTQKPFPAKGNAFWGKRNPTGLCHQLQRRGEGSARLSHYMQINLRGLDARVTEQFLHRGDICSAFERMSREAMPEHMTRDSFRDSHPFRRLHRLRLS